MDSGLDGSTGLENFPFALIVLDFNNTRPINVTVIDTQCKKAALELATSNIATPYICSFIWVWQRIIGNDYLGSDP